MRKQACFFINLERKFYRISEISISVDIFQIYKTLILEKDNYWSEYFSINFLSFFDREFFCGTAHNETDLYPSEITGLTALY